MSRIGNSLALVAILFIIGNEAHLVGKICGELPSGRHGASAVWDGANRIYFIGGTTRSDTEFPQRNLNEIVELNILTKKSQVVSKLPLDLANGGAGADEQGNIFYFGGQGNYPVGSQTAIYKFSHSKTVPEVVAHLPEPSTNLAVVRVGQTSLYLIRGVTAQILHFDTISHEVKVLDTKLPLTVSRASAYYDEVKGVIYITGGYHNQTQNRDIFTFNPVTLETGVLDSILVSYGVQTAAYTQNGQGILMGSASGEFKFNRFHSAQPKLQELEVDIELGIMNGPTSVYVPTTNNLYLIGAGGNPPYDYKVHCIDLRHG